jgi:hypothetical protein
VTGATRQAGAEKEILLLAFSARRGSRRCWSSCSPTPAAAGSRLRALHVCLAVSALSTRSLAGASHADAQYGKGRGGPGEGPAVRSEPRPKGRSPQTRSARPKASSFVRCWVIIYPTIQPMGLPISGACVLAAKNSIPDHPSRLPHVPLKKKKFQIAPRTVLTCTLVSSTPKNVRKVLAAAPNSATRTR